MHSEIVIFLMGFQQKIRALHWQTTSYPRHKAYGKTYEDLDDLIDNFAEVSMGKYGRVKFNNATIVINDIGEDSLNDLLNNAIERLNAVTGELSQTDTDLLNIRDEMLQAINQLKYLLTLK